jgi:lysophospholipase L1-like esterase
VSFSKFSRVALFLVLSHIALAQATGEHWVATWSTAVVARPQVAPPTPAPNSPAATQPPPVISINNQTVRQFVHTSIGGGRVRIVLTNTFGTAPIQIGAVHLALRDKDSKIAASSGKAMTFSGRPTVTIPAGASMISDPVSEAVPALGDLAIDIYLPSDAVPAASPLTAHGAAFTTNYLSTPGNFAGAAEIPVSQTTLSWFLLARVEVTAPEEVGAIVTYGDSITDGTRSTPDTNGRWPDQLARRLLQKPGNAKLAVVNAAIAGNRLLSEGAQTAGINALARMDRDVLAEAGVTHVIVMEGINDIGGARQNPTPGAADIIAAQEQLIARAHAKGLKIFGATLTPFDGAAYFTPEGEAKRQAVNTWIRTSKAYDGVIDFDAVVRDPANPSKILPAYDSSDHLHPNDAGYLAMGNSIDLGLFATARPVKLSKK